MMTTQHYLDGHILVRPGLVHSTGLPVQALGRPVVAAGRCERVNDQWTPAVLVGGRIVWEGDVQASHEDAERVASRHIETVLDHAAAGLFNEGRR